MKDYEVNYVHQESKTIPDTNYTFETAMMPARLPQQRCGRSDQVNEKEYIERDEVLKRIKLVVYVDSTEESHGEVSFDEIESIPAEDVEPVVRGEWIKHETFEDGKLDDRWYECSICHEERSFTNPTKRCPDCGAHMMERSRSGE